MLKKIGIGTAATLVAAAAAYGLYQGYQNFFGKKADQSPCCPEVETPEVVGEVDVPEIQVETPMDIPTYEPTVTEGNSDGQ